MFISFAYQLSLSATRLIYHVLFSLSTPFLNFFQNFFEVFSNQFRSGERGIWTLAPLLTTYSLSRGAPSTTWVLLHLVESHSFRNLLFSSVPGTNQSQLRIHTVNGESGIRTHAPFRTNGFQDRLVMTTSISLQAFSQTYFTHFIPYFRFCQALF